MILIERISRETTDQADDQTCHPTAEAMPGMQDWQKNGGERCSAAYLSSHPPAHLKKGQLWAKPLGCAGRSSGVSWKLRSLLPVFTSNILRMSCRVSRGFVGSTLLNVTRYFSPGLN